MITAPAHETQIDGPPLRLPALARLRLHQSWTQPQPVSATQVAELWLADLDSPVRLSRWAKGFRSCDLGAFAAEQFAARKSEILAACDRSTGRVLMLAQPTADADAPRISWVLDAEGTVVATVAEVMHADERLGLVVTGADGVHATGELTMDGITVHVEGQLLSHLDADGIRVGLQLTSPDGTPLITMSMTGTLASGSSRALIQSAQRQAAAQRVLAA